MATPDFPAENYQLVGGQTIYESGVLLPFHFGSMTGISSQQNIVAVNPFGSSNELHPYPTDDSSKANIFYTNQIIQRESIPKFRSTNRLWHDQEFWDFSSIWQGTWSNVDYEKTIYLPHGLVESMDDEALHWLATRPHLVSVADSLYQASLDLIHDYALSATSKVTTFADMEADVAETLMLEVKIANKTYEEILQLWDEFTIKLLSNLPTEIQKKLTIVLDQA
jgi:hypothetical protein